MRYARTLTPGERDLQQIYRNVFSTPEGQRVLACILTDLGMFDRTEGEAGQALKNYGIRLMEIMGIFDERNIEELVRGLIKLPAYQEE